MIRVKHWLQTVSFLGCCYIASNQTNARQEILSGVVVQMMDCTHYAYFRSSSLESEETHTFMNISQAEMPRNLEFSSKCSVKAIKNTTLCKLQKVSKAFMPMGSNADESYWIIP